MRLIRTTPAPIWIIAILFLILPILSYIATANAYRLSLLEIHQVIFSMQPFQILILLFSVFVSIGILSRHILGYYTFLVFSGILILYNLWLATMQYSGTKIEVGGVLVTPYDILGNFFFSVFLLTGVFYFLNKEVSAPYFSEYARGWRRDPRETIPLPFRCKWGDTEVSGVTINVSQSGAFLPWEGDSYPEEGSLLPLALEFENRKGDMVQFTFESIVMRITRNPELPGTVQIGVRFLASKVNKEGIREIEYFLRERYAPRYPIQQEISFGWETFEDMKALVSDISPDGMYIESSVKAKIADELYIKIPVIPPIRLEGRVSWINPDGKYGKKPGFGIHIVLNRNPIRYKIWLLKIRMRKLKAR